MTSTISLNRIHKWGTVWVCAHFIHQYDDPHHGKMMTLIKCLPKKGMKEIKSVDSHQRIKLTNAAYKKLIVLIEKEYSHIHLSGLWGDKHNTNIVRKCKSQYEYNQELYDLYCGWFKIDFCYTNVDVDLSAPKDTLNTLNNQ